jgi:lipopolysaccharide transport system permease protein
MTAKDRIDAGEVTGKQHVPGKEPIPEFEIRPAGRVGIVDLGEVWAYRELIYFLTWRDVKVRYKQTAIGILWAALQPAAMMAVFTLIFGRLAGLPAEGMPYPVFALAALVPWLFFARTLAESTNSLVTDQRLISRVYFPRIIVPAATSLAAMVDFLISGLLLAAVMAYFEVTPGPSLIWLPLIVLLMLVAALGVGFWLSALNIEFRDVMYTIPFLTQFWFFATPVVYSSRQIPEGWRTLYAINPMVGVVDGFRWTLFGRSDLPGATLLVSAMSAAVIFVSGLVWFRNRERTFVDIIGSGGR